MPREAYFNFTRLCLNLFYIMMQVGRRGGRGRKGLCKVFWAMFYFNASCYHPPLSPPPHCSVQLQHHGEMENDLNPLSLLQLLSFQLPLPSSSEKNKYKYICIYILGRERGGERINRLYCNNKSDAGKSCTATVRWLG